VIPRKNLAWDHYIDKHVTSFNIEHELRKINIIVPLIELMKKYHFKRSIMNSLHPLAYATSSDVINQGEGLM
jgi:hypothetical protein